MIPRQVIIHHSLTRDSGTVSWDAIRRYHTETKGWKDVGYHWALELVGGHYEALAGRMMNEQGAHTRHQNFNSLGICFVGNFDETEVPQAQWALGVRLVRSLCELLSIRPYRVKGHREYAGYKSCPGKHFNLDIFRDEIRRA